MRFSSFVAFYITVLGVAIMALCALVLFGCGKPALSSAFGPCAGRAAACCRCFVPQWVPRAVSVHAATAGANVGLGFVMVRYMVKGKPMRLFCTPSTNVEDPRRANRAGEQLDFRIANRRRQTK